jgi:hypothetical protein
MSPASGKWRRGKWGLVLLVVMPLLSGCAGLTSVWWSTETPGQGDVGGRAIHLDAKQRLAITSGGEIPKVCAEPSPDALSAFASAIGAGVTLPNQASASFAQALQETSGSIGLRTQSITLMRDSMYRLCEAYFNRAINQPQMVSLLARSQDLTVTILAIEQLTGAVVASQVGLGGTANASASANLVGNQQLLDAARANQTAREADLTAAKADLQKKQAEQTRVKGELDAVNTKLGASPAPTGDDKTQLDGQKAKLEKDLGDAKTAADAAQKAVDRAGVQVADATKNVEVTQNNRAAALTQATAAASGSVTFSNARQTTLSDAAVEKVAAAVRGIVDVAMTKSYTEDNCFALLSALRSARTGENTRTNIAKTSEGVDTKAEAFTEQVLNYCQKFVEVREKQLGAGTPGR